MVTAHPPASVDWLKEGDTIQTGDRWVFQTDGLLIKDVTL